MGLETCMWVENYFICIHIELRPNINAKMGLSNIFKKSESLGKKSLNTFLQVNKYDDPKNAMELIGHICTAAKDIDFTDELYPIMELLWDMEDEREAKKFAWNDDLFSKIYNVLQQLEKSYLDNTYQLKIAVSGGYSAGKSTFMNMLIGEKEFLPTDMNPTSLVNTYINFNNKISKPVVRGENIKNDLVLLDEDVLASIRHDTQNAKAIANVLRRLIIDVACKNYLDGITFIDTPGYDNSLTVNRENGTTDKDTAGKAFKDADVIFWCANIGKQVTEEDLKFIGENGGDEKPVVILLSRMKSKASSDIPSIVKSCYNTATKRLKNVMDVIAFDKDASLDEVYSYKRNSMSALFEGIKDDYQETVLELCRFTIEDFFNEEMSKSKELQSDLKKKYNEVVEKLNEARKNSSSLSEDNKDWNNELRKIIIDSYNNMMQVADNIAIASSYAIDSFEEFYDNVSYWDGHDHDCFSNTLTPILKKGLTSYQKCCNKHNEAIQHKYFEEEWRKEIYQHFVSLSEDFAESDPWGVDDYENKKQELNNGMAEEKRCQQCINKYQPKMLDMLVKVNEKCADKRRKHYRNLETLAKTEERDIFSAITGGNMERFIHAFHTGVELTLCNNLGYNVLTWIASCGSTEMIEFLLMHKDDKGGIDMGIKDKNGMNIMEAAVVAHNKQACQLLQKSIPSLRIPTKRMEELARQNDFTSWIKTL